MSFCMQTCLIFILSVNEIVCRSVESDTMPTIVDAVNQPNNTMSNRLSSTTEPPPRSFDICEEFGSDDDGNGNSLKLHDREFAVTVVMEQFTKKNK